MDNVTSGDQGGDTSGACAASGNLELTMVVFCAAHITEAVQIEQLRQMLDSWRSCTEVKVPLWLSTSGDPLPEDLAASTDDGLYTVCESGAARLSQFEHYALLAEGLAAAVASQNGSDESVETYSAEDPWVIFTAPDALWHPSRALEGVRLFAAAKYSGRAVRGLAWKRFAVAAQPLLPTTAADVDALIAADEALCCVGRVNEYWARGVSLSTLREFIRESSGELLRNDFACQYFVRWVDGAPDAEFSSFDPARNPGWSYFSRGTRPAIARPEAKLNWIESEAVRATMQSLTATERQIVHALVLNAFTLGADGAAAVTRDALEHATLGTHSAATIANACRPLYPLVEEIFRDDYFARLGRWDTTVRLTDA